MKRRFFVRLLAAGSAALAFGRHSMPRALAATAPLTASQSSIVRALRELLSTPQHAHRLGRQYLRLHPDRADAAILIAELGPELATLAPGDAAALRDYINQRQRRDFAEGNTVMLGNWILARTELTLCALVSLA